MQETLHIRRNAHSLKNTQKRDQHRGNERETQLIWRYFTPLNKDQAKCDMYYKLIWC